METPNCTHTITDVHRSPSVELSSRLKVVFGLVHAWMARSRQRDDLSRLDDAALRDIGLTRFDVDQEISKPFWQP